MTGCSAYRASITNNRTRKTEVVKRRGERQDRHSEVVRLGRRFTCTIGHIKNAHQPMLQLVGTPESECSPGSNRGCLRDDREGVKSHMISVMSHVSVSRHGFSHVLMYGCVRVRNNDYK